MAFVVDIFMNIFHQHFKFKQIYFILDNGNTTDRCSGKDSMESGIICHNSEDTRLNQFPDSNTGHGVMEL